jgi:actin-like ATPase involved in cell morphogenesis
MSLLSLRTIYIAFSEERLFVCELSNSAGAIEISPAIAISAEHRVLAVGDEALASSSARIVRPFQHDRLVFHEFEAAQAILRHVMHRLTMGVVLRKPRIVVHPLKWTTAQLTDIEKRALLELAFSIGAHSAALYFGTQMRELSESEHLGFIQANSGPSWL